MSGEPIVIDHVDHFFGARELRRQVLSDVTTSVRRGEIVILTGPSGSGKTTLLTLIGALRSTQSGSLHVLGQELSGASEARLAEVRRRIGYVFQAHNLLDALTARQNVRMSLELDPALADVESDRRVEEALDAVGLADRAYAHPHELSGGQRQRVAIARALARRPEIVLADEPTASLDRETGRAVVEILERLARRDGVTVVLVTHDNRILDVADRILTLEDGRLQSPVRAVTGDARRRLGLLVRDLRRGELLERIESLDTEAFGQLLQELTEETRSLLDVADLVQSDAFESVLDQVVRAFTRKTEALRGAETAVLHFADASGRMPRTGRDGETWRPGISVEGDRLVLPVDDSQGHSFGVVEVATPRNRERFTESDEARLREMTRSLALVLESWWRMSCACRTARAGRTCPCCDIPWHVPARESGADPPSI